MRSPGDVLLEDFMGPTGLDTDALARRARVSKALICHIAKGIRRITPRTAMRLAEVFENKPEFWMDLQTAYDLETLRNDA